MKLLPTGRERPRQGHFWLARTLTTLLVLLGWALVRAQAAGDIPKFPEFTAETGREYLRSVADLVQAQPGLDSEAAFGLARVRSHLGEKQASEQLARQALAKNPKRADVAALLAEILILQDRMEEAAGLLRDALQSNPNIPGGYRRLGMALDRLGERDAAHDALIKAVRTAPSDATARMLLGRVLLDRGQAKEAEGHLREACRLDPRQAGAYYLLAQVQTQLSQPDAAAESLKKFQELKRQEKTAYDLKDASYDDEKFMRTVAAEFHTLVAGSLLRLGQAPAAEAHLRQAVLVAPAEAAAHEMLAALLLQSGRLAEARGECETLVRLQPREASYRVNLGTVLLRLRELAQGVEQLKRALELDPDQPQALNNLARHYLGTNQELPEALRLAQRLVKAQPSAPNYDLLGWACFANGQIEQARAAASEAVRRDPANPTYRERHQKLQAAP